MYIKRLSYIGIYLWKSGFGLTWFYFFFLRFAVKGKTSAPLTGVYFECRFLDAAFLSFIRIWFTRLQRLLP